MEKRDLFLRMEKSAEGKPFSHFWKECLAAGRANEGLRADWQEQLKEAVEKCGLMADDIWFPSMSERRSRPVVIYNKW